MTPHLDSISITDFRSISGTITVPLDSPVVLIHGANRAGKTSVLSALELALTGEIPAMKRTEPNYREHLVQRGADVGRIVLTTSGLPSSTQAPYETTLGYDKHQSAPLLPAVEARFFSERCFLAQASLSRLLEIYQYASASEDSALTRFVQDLLGLDTLEALITGLHATGDIRNMRRLVPEWDDTERRIATTSARLAKSRARLREASDQAARSRAAIRATLGVLAPQSLSAVSEPELPANTEEILASQDEEHRLVVTITLRREATSISERLTSVSGAPQGLEQASAEEFARDARGVLEAWKAGDGKKLETLIDELRAVFPDLPSVASTDPRVANATASTRVETDLARCNRTLADDDAALVRVEQLRQTIEQSRARVLVIDQQLGQVAGDAESLSRALADMLPHVHDEACPVCGRDFKDVSEEPLVQHVSARITDLTEQAGRIQGLARARIDAGTSLADAERLLESSSAGLLASEARIALKSRVSDLNNAKRRLDELADAVDLGVEALRREAEAQQALSQILSRDRVLVELRTALASLYERAGLPQSDPIEPLSDSLARLEEHVAAAEANLTQRATERRDALSQYHAQMTMVREIEDLGREIALDEATLERCNEGMAIAGNRREAAKSLARQADKVRGEIVRRVFNDALNRVWRDLFVRLAPTEPYVPAFRVPTTSGPVHAQLETVHRDGGSGGAPGAMLSAGNLNTAALTLFLALHLSVRPQLPWLILDDPVQSMDEVHIAQFAGLLRTLAREHDRQIVIAVHERPLFDYLALELSPAFSGDRLITVELTQHQDRASIADPKFHEWSQDKAVAA